MTRDTPAQAALEFTVPGVNKYRAHRGCHCTNPISVLWTDLKEAKIGTLESKKDLRELRMLAEDKTQKLMVED